MKRDSNSKYFKIIPSNPKYCQLPRADQTILTRARLGTCTFSHNHLFTRTELAECDTCQCPLTFKHAFLRCELFSTSRNKIITYLKSQNIPINMCNMLDESIPNNLLITHLHEINKKLKI